MSNNTNKIYDVVIVGSGPAGMTTAIYTTRREMSTLILAKDIGGQMAKTVVIENYPGIQTTDGVSLAFQMKDQAEKLGAEIALETAESIEKKDNIFLIKSKNKEYQARSVVLAFGLEKRHLGIESEEKFVNKGISYCVTCDGPMMKDKNVAVVGGGNSGAEAVEYLAKICPKVYWLEITEKIRAEEALLNKIKQMDNVEILTQSQMTQFLGEEKLNGAKIKTTDGEKEIQIEGAIIEIGYIARTEWLRGLVEFDQLGQVKVDEHGQTKTPGLFAAGDVTNTKYKQIVVAEGSAAIAALEAYNYVNSN